MDSPRNHVIIYSHGFGVERDARGMFTDIVAAFPDAKNVMFDYNIPDPKENTLTVRPLTEQKDILLAEIARAKEQFPNATIDIIAHSFGCITTALAMPDGIRKAIFLAPPLEMKSTSLERFANRPGSDINPDGPSRLARSDGSFTLVPAVFWKEREAIDPTECFNSFSEKTRLTVIFAKQDNVISSEKKSLLSPRVQVIEIDGDHDFRYESRSGLIETLTRIL